MARERGRTPRKTRSAWRPDPRTRPGAGRTPTSHAEDDRGLTRGGQADAQRPAHDREGFVVPGDLEQLEAEIVQRDGDARVVALERALPRFEFAPAMKQAIRAGAVVKLGCDHTNYPAHVAIAPETLASLAGDLR